ncbi:Mth938-like domain-containing protein [Azonexus sp.]|uniref:Mth938-like domain-containing protein n=1 Tax=Azonexus sp. TaxID=1872668 RepID=UPI002827DDA5|nr:Mth938-like domain-containing protein [Azonexus sp.]MDR1994293.1 Mth938-like domain-containing protein [Azonexus sp.]
MKLHLSNAAGLNLFTAHGDGYVAVNHERHTGNLIVRPESIVTGWTEATAATLSAGDLERLLELQVGIILLGTGSRLRFPPAQWLKPFAQTGIGLEIMDLPAACRTYNILASEGRQVAAALLFD